MMPRTLFPSVYGPMPDMGAPARFGAAIESTSVSPGICFAHNDDGYAGGGSPVETIARERVDLLDVPVPHFDPKHRDTALVLRRIVRGVTCDTRDESQRQFWRALVERFFPGRALSSSKGRALSPSKGRAPASIKALEIGFGFHLEPIGNMLDAGFEVTGTEMAHCLPVLGPVFFTNPVIRAILDAMKSPSFNEPSMGERDAMRAGRLHLLEAAEFEEGLRYGRGEFDIILLNMPQPSAVFGLLDIVNEAIRDGGIVVIVTETYFDYFKAFLNRHNLWETVLMDRQNNPHMFQTDNPHPESLIGVFRAPVQLQTLKSPSEI